MSAQLEVGKTYKITSSRKGTFVAKLTRFDETWATAVIVDGKAKAMMEYNEREKGEEITVRRSFCSFTPVEGGTK
jgi:uncharacterized protein (UPF0179 family)